MRLTLATHGKLDSGLHVLYERKKYLDGWVNCWLYRNTIACEIGITEKENKLRPKVIRVLCLQYAVCASSARTFGGVYLDCASCDVVDGAGTGIGFVVDLASEFILMLESLVCVDTSSIAFDMRDSVKSSSQPSVMRVTT